MPYSEDFALRLKEHFSRYQRTTIDLPGYLRAGVLVPIILDAGGPLVLFTKRTESVETHKGQISFPGGMVDPEDTSIEMTALREWEEEVGISAGLVEIAGVADDLSTPTGWIITPVVGILRSLPHLQVNPHEVADVFTVPLAHFADDRNGRTELRESQGQQRQIWFFDVAGHTIWGATGRIIRSLAVTCREF